MKAPYARVTIGLGVGRAAVRAVAVRAGRVLWAVERARSDDESLARTLDALLAGAPRTRWPRPRVVAAVGPAYVQMKKLIGLPEQLDSTRLGAVVRESAARFFLKNGVPLATIVLPVRDGPPWGAAIEQPVLDDITGVCRQRRLVLSAVVPTVAVMGASLRSAGPVALTWCEGDLRLEIVRSGGELVALRRLTASPAARVHDEPIAPTALAHQLGADAARFADALAAAETTREAVPGWSRGGPGDDRRASAWRVVLAAAALVLAILSALIAPVLVAHAAERRARARLASVAERRGELAVLEGELARLTTAFGEVQRFDAERLAITVFVAALTRVLPEESAIVALRVSRAGGTVVVLTPRAAVMLNRLEQVRGIVGAKIIGPVTREAVGGKALERLTIRFRLTAAGRSEPS